MDGAQRGRSRKVELVSRVSGEDLERLMVSSWRFDDGCVRQVWHHQIDLETGEQLGQ